MFEKLVHDGLLNLSHVYSSLTLVERSDTENYDKLSFAITILKSLGLFSDAFIISAAFY